MRWYVKLLQEDDGCIFIAYSYERNSACDGVLKYDKGRRDLAIERMSDGADELATRLLFGPIHGLLRAEGRIPEERKCICAG